MKIQEFTKGKFHKDFLYLLYFLLFTSKEDEASTQRNMSFRRGLNLCNACTNTSESVREKCLSDLASYQLNLARVRAPKEHFPLSFHRGHSSSLRLERRLKHAT